MLLLVLLTNSPAILCDSSITKVHLITIDNTRYKLWSRNCTRPHDFLRRTVPKTSHEQELNFSNCNCKLQTAIRNTDHNILESTTFLVVVHISPRGSPPLGGALVPGALPPWAEP